MKTDWIIVDHSGAHWPGLLPYRGESSRKGYPTYEAAHSRMVLVLTHYAATRGKYGPALTVQERVRG